MAPTSSRRKSSSLIPPYLALLSVPYWMFFLTECPSLLTQQERGRAFGDPRVHSAFGVPVGEGSWHLMEGGGPSSAPPTCSPQEPHVCLCLDFDI